MDNLQHDTEYQNQTIDEAPLQAPKEKSVGDISEITESLKAIAKSLEETAQASKSTKTQKLELSNQLIITMHTFLMCGGLEKTECSKLSTYISKELDQFEASLSSLYHYGEVAEFFFSKLIEPTTEIIPSIRAITRVNQKIRDQVWEAAKTASGSEVPSIKAIKNAAKKIQDGLANVCNSTEIGTAYRRTYEMLEKADLSIEKLQQMQLRVNEMQKAHENDEFGFLKLQPNELGDINKVIRYLITTHPEADKNSESEFSTAN